MSGSFLGGTTPQTPWIVSLGGAVRRRVMPQRSCHKVSDGANSRLVDPLAPTSTVHGVWGVYPPEYLKKPT